MKSNHVEVCNESLQKMIFALGGKSPENSTFVENFSTFENYKNTVESIHIKNKTGLDDSKLNDFITALRKLKNYLNSEDSNTEIERVTQIASLRLFDWFDLISKKLPQCKPNLKIELDEKIGIKQVRAAELVIRSLIGEKYDDQDMLKRFVHEYFLKEEIYQGILNRAVDGDILSGTDFSQLIALFLKKDEFKEKYLSIYDETPFLKYQKNKRDTLNFFLDDIRRIRNDIAHLKPLSYSKIELLNIYYEEITKPIQDAHDKGHVHVDPTQHLEIDDRQLLEYREKIKDELANINTELVQISGNVGWVRGHLRWIIIGLPLLALLLVFITYLIQQVRSSTEQLKGETTVLSMASSVEKNAIEQDPSTIGLINLKLEEPAEKSTASKGISISAAVYLNIKESSLKDVLVNAIVETTSLPKNTINISALLANSNAADVQIVQFEVPADTKHISVCMTANHPTLHQPYTAIWSYALGVTGGTLTLMKDRSAQMRQGSAQSCL